MYLNDHYHHRTTIKHMAFTFTWTPQF